MSDVESAVRTLLAAAGLPASDAEVAALTASYPAMRRSVDEMYTVPEVRYLDPALRFRADAVGPVVNWAD